MSDKCIAIRGAREHNLQNVNVTLPRNRLTVITGLSGSGKSSLAFDTLYAEGQRRYVESLSAYARQFLNQLQKPDVDQITGLSPAISIEQRTAGTNPRSTVATTTELHDYLRLLFANIGHAHCPACGRAVDYQSPQQMVEHLVQLPNRTRLVLLAPMVRGQKGTQEDVLTRAGKQGFVRVRVDGQIHDLEHPPTLDAQAKHDIDLVVDRLIITSRIRTRLTDSVELTLKHGNGVMIVLVQAGSKNEKELLFSEKLACPHCSISFEPLTSRSFSFNSPYGACPTCHGLGSELVMDEDLIIPHRELSIDDGAIHAWRRGGRRLVLYYKRLLNGLSKQYAFGLDVPFKDLPQRIQHLLLHGSGEEEVQFGYWRGGAWKTYRKPFEGILPNLKRRYEETQSQAARQRLRQYMNRTTCSTCGGSRLKPEVTACTVGGRSIVDVTRFSILEAKAFFDGLKITPQETRIIGEVLKEIHRRLGFLVDVGLDYLTLDRESGSLSGGELQRIRLATQIGSGLVGVLYVLDEPTIGLHVRDNLRLIRILKTLRDAGNTVVVVEHDEEMIRQADHIIDLGPGAGIHGGRVLCEGSLRDLLNTPASLTARYLNRDSRIRIPLRRRKPTRNRLKVVEASENNLKNIDVEIPLGLFVCVTGVSGSGKSTLVDDILKRALFRKFYGSKEAPGQHKRITGAQRLNKVIVIDQTPIGRTPRSNPATYTGAFSVIRSLFSETPASKVRGYGPGRYSFNVKGGRCEPCKGDGLLKLEMHFLPDVYVTCEHCQGARYNRETLEVQYKGKTIADVLAMTVDEGLAFFASIPAIERKMRTLADVGLGYLQIGQSATTLSGGEAQRIKLASELSKQATGETLYLLDEPTTGLHFADVQNLLVVLHRLRDAGNTIVVIEHNMDVIKTADYLIDLGPEGGNEGGEIVAQGPPEEVARCARSHTGRHLKEALQR